ncbi:Holliday junction resolvase RuvX [bacterium]|uniref:Putative pre-16S rRNA nuclease n=1 Tax=candidate division WOR-3 bacterium TaxID=2052148 RepID=A0A7C0VBK0_UNCW3|nr:MAG: Holliday junction resolvase RuvX [bacterium]RKZ20852.1 MAG: Holliday junction resolvase RuvX [bacterium]HDI83377.1 Holliday junction resolvase RuvX [candidate division WOR-3 bacterium]
MGRILGIDYGEKRVGIAITNPLNIPMPLETVSSDRIMHRIEELLNEYEIDLIVVGNPMEGKRREMVERFIEKLKSNVKVKVVEWDESFTSRRAEEVMRKMKKKPSKDRGAVDRIAASIILEEYLSSN